MPLPTATQFKPLRGSEPLPGLSHSRCPAEDMGKDQPQGRGWRSREAGEPGEGSFQGGVGKRGTSQQRKGNKPNRSKMLFFKRIAAIRGKQTQTTYHFYYQTLTGVSGPISGKFEWMPSDGPSRMELSEASGASEPKGAIRFIFNNIPETQPKRTQTRYRSYFQILRGVSDPILRNFEWKPLTAHQGLRSG